MKKFTALMACLCLGSAAMTAANVVPKFIQDNAKISMTEAQQQRFRQATAQTAFAAMQNPDEAMYTRTWTDPTSGNVWTMQLLKQEMPLCEMLVFQDEEGNAFQYTFEELPFYTVQQLLWMEDAATGQYTTQVGFILCWPSYYIWEQVFDYDGPLTEDGDIPEDKCNWDCVDAEELINSTEWCKRFQESSGIGGVLNSAQDNWEYLTMLPNELLGFVGVFEGSQGYTTITESKASIVKFNSMDAAADNTIDCQTTIYFTTDAGVGKTKRVNYVGPSRVEGFKSNTYNLPEFGDVYLLNLGEGSSAENMDYPEEWGPLSQFYFAVADKYVTWNIDPAATKLSPSVLQLGTLQLPEGEVFDLHANVMRGWLYGEPSLAADNSQNVEKVLFQCVEGTEGYDEQMDEYYYSIAPKANSFVSYGYEGSWSDEYGMRFNLRNFSTFVDVPSAIVWGTTEGLWINLTDVYTNKINAKSTGKVHYYYDPNDPTAVREYSLVGDMEYSEVKTVEAEAAKVSAANGVISVVAAENGNVAVYALSGAVVANKSVKAGETLSVAADKGVYVVVANGKAVKVAL